MAVGKRKVDLFPVQFGLDHAAKVSPEWSCVKLQVQTGATPMFSGQTQKIEEYSNDADIKKIYKKAAN